MFDFAGPKNESEEKEGDEGGLPEEGVLEGLVFTEAVVLKASDCNCEAKGGESVAEVEDEALNRKDSSTLGGGCEAIEFAGAEEIGPREHDHGHHCGEDAPVGPSLTK